MNKSKKWETVSELKSGPKGTNSKEHPSQTECSVDDVVKVLLANRGLKTQKDIEQFLHPKVEDVTIASVGIDQKAVEKTIGRLNKAKENHEGVVVFGDYDVDGITGTAIMWETLYGLSYNVIPYIPHRVDEGYGLSKKGIDNVLKEKPDTKVIITVDNGIVANEAVDYAKEKGIDVVISDHHTVGEKQPNAYAIVHTTKLCGSGVAYLLSQEVRRDAEKNAAFERPANRRGEAEVKKAYQSVPNDHLALVALATVADLVPLREANRALLVAGLNALHHTNRPGLRALCEEAQVKPEEISTYTIGHVIGPRLNAMGRMESAMDSLRLLCTKDRLQAKVYADKLGRTNRQRQEVTKSLSELAVEMVLENSEGKKILIVASDQFPEGVIGLIAGNLKERFGLPAIAIAIGKEVSKASARSVNGYNIIESIRTGKHFLLNAGGHPMAAGFSIETAKITPFTKHMQQRAEKELTDELLQQVVKIDCPLPLNMITEELYNRVQELGPFGVGNPEPVFSAEAIVNDLRTVGQDGNHLKLRISHPRQQSTERSNYMLSGNMDAIGFGMGEHMVVLERGKKSNFAYTIDMNVWNGRKNLQLKVKDIQPTK